MAKKKETQDQVEQLKAAEEVEMKEQVSETPESSLEEIQTTENTIIKNEKKDKVEIPAMVNVILKSYPDYQKLYIDRFGGVFTVDSQPSLVEDAILYQNPYYNK